MINNIFSALIFLKGCYSRESKRVVKFILFVSFVFGSLSSLSYAQTEDTTQFRDLCGAFVSVDQAKAADYGPGSDVTMTTPVQALATIENLNNILIGNRFSKPCDNAVAAAQENTNYGVRAGLLGMQEDAIISMLSEPPQQNVYAHLADEWIPNSIYDTTTRVYAAESGYDYLMDSGIVGIWQSMRDISYVLFIVVLIIAGFMIMFRHKIGGQAAVTIMSTIPNVIVSLILVTFSFAIVGLMMNLGAILTQVLKGMLDLGDSAIIVEHPFSISNNFWFGSTDLAAGARTMAIVTLILNVVGVFFAVLLGPGILMAILVLGTAGVVMWISFKVFFTLVKAYVGILIDTALAPIYLLIGAIPGQEDKRADWFRRVMKNVLVFPVVFFFVNLGIYLYGNVNSLTMPMALSGGEGDATLGPVMTDFILAIVTLFLFNLAGEAPKILEDFLPQAGGKNFAEAVKLAGSKIPLVGGLFS